MKRARPITEADVDRGLQLAALLDVLSYAARSFEDLPDQSNVGRLTHHIGQSLELASRIAGELVAHMEEHEQNPDGTYRWKEGRAA